MRHPEQLPDEAFIMNIAPEKVGEIKWQSKRCGSAAYDSVGRTIPGRVPVFVKHREIVRQPGSAGFVHRLKKEEHW